MYLSVPTNLKTGERDFVFPHLLYHGPTYSYLSCHAVKILGICLVFLERVVIVRKWGWAADSVRTVIEGRENRYGIQFSDHDGWNDEVDADVQFFTESHKEHGTGNGSRRWKKGVRLLSLTVMV